MTSQAFCGLYNLKLKKQPQDHTTNLGPVPISRLSLMCPFNRYCEMATWSPATANCEHPEDSTEMVVPLSTTTISGGGRGNGSAGGSAGYRGRRIGSRSSRTASEGSEGGAEEDRSWRRDGEGTSAERRWSDGGSAIGGGNGGRGRGRAKKDDLLWVQCDKCEKWRKLANGMRNEDLPEKW